MKVIFFLILFLSIGYRVDAQQNSGWNGKKCAVVLTYDDALNVHLDNVIPLLDSVDIRGTFYIVGESNVLRERMEEWRYASEKGHELGNHTLTHPCDANKEGRSWVQQEKDLSNYSVERAVNEINITTTILQAIDGKTERTFAYPCGDTKAGGEDFYSLVQDSFVGARGVDRGLESLEEIDLKEINCYGMSDKSGSDMIDLVNEAMESNKLIVFLFHGVGGEHGLNVSLEAHRELVQYISRNRDKIWIAPLVEVSKYAKENQNRE